MRDLFRRAAVMVVAVAGAGVLAGGMMTAAPGTAAAATTFTAAGAVLPAGVVLDPDVGPSVWLASVSCASAGNCTAVGFYGDSSGDLQGLLLTQTSGTWGPGVQAVLPTDPPEAVMSSVSCASAGNCTAVGRYNVSSGNPLKGAGTQQGLLLTETAGTWAPGIPAPLPAGAGAPLAYLSSVSCASAGNCTAVGFYGDSSGDLQGLLLTQTSGTWGPGVQAVLPTDPPEAVMSSVSCASAGNCTAVGDTFDSSGDSQEGLLLTETAGTWAPGVQAVLPAGATQGNVGSVSCASAGNCTAVGGYTDSSGNFQGLLLTETAGTWAAGTEASLPAGAAANPDVNLASLSCASAGNCAAVGSYTDSSGDTQALALTETAGTWATGVEAPLPAGAAANPEASLFSVSCPSPGNCAAGGSYVDNSGPTVDSSGHTQVVLLTETAGTWAAAEAAPPAGGLANPFFPLLTMGVSCASAGNCTAVASYNLGTNNVQPVVLTETAGTWAAGVQVPTPAGSTFGRLFSVSCASAGECTAVGYYGDISSNSWHGLLVSQTSAQPTTTALASSPDPSASGQAVTYTATVSPPPDGGTAAFTDNGTPITGCTAQPVSTSTGQATCQTTPSSAGAHNITAAFSGTGSFTASTSATLTQVVTKAACPSLAGCNLSGLNLTNAQLPGANLSGANLNGTSLTGANLTSANLTSANLKSANLTGANLTGANLSGANLNSANLTGANLTGANLSGANLNKVTWSNTTCPDGTNSNADGGTCTAHL